MTQLSPLVLRNLEGSTRTVASAELVFEKSRSHLPAAREGGEGYAVPVEHAGKRFMLKSYFLPTVERKQRATFISALALHELLPTFQAAPLRVIDGKLSASQADSIDIAGYLAPLVDGETFEGLINDQIELSPRARIRLAAQLCGTARVLERNHIAHGDLAMSNVMVTDVSSGTPNLRFIDFDGFYHPVVPTIPCSRERGGRGFGQDGYRHRAYQSMDCTTTITSDRAAMAALAFELVTLRWADTEELQRMTALDQSDIDRGAPSTSDVMVARWPEGWDLVQRAFAAPLPELAPSPEDWFEALERMRHSARTPTPPVATAAASHESIALRILERGQSERRVNLRNAGNSFATVSSRLAWLSYARNGQHVELRGAPGSTAVFMTRAGKLSKFTGHICIALQSGDEIQWDDFTFQVG